MFIQMSVENSVLGSNSRRERKERQINAVRRLIREELPVEIRRKRSRGRNELSGVLGRSTDRELPFFISRYPEDESPFRMIYVREQDMRRYTNAYLLDLSNYFPDNLLISEVTSQNRSEEEIYKILDLEDKHEDRIVMVRDQQVGLQEDIYDECYFFLVEI